MSRREWILVGLVVVLAATLAGVFIGTGSRPPSELAEAGPEPAYWTCAMHTSVHLDHDGQCPICGMDLVPVYPHEAMTDVPASAGEMSDRDDMANMPGMPGMSGPPAVAVGSTPEQRATFRVEPEWQQAIGVRSAVVAPRTLEQSLRLPGRVAMDETRMVDVNLRVAGWIETLHVGETGQVVEAGQKLLDLYSPELVTAQRDLLVAVENADRLAASPVEEARDGAASLVRASRQRLLRFGLTEVQVDEVAHGGELRETIPILAPSDGYVLEKMAVDGMRVDPGMRLYRIVDLSTVWVLVDVFEGDAGFVRVGQPATFRLSYGGDSAWRGRVDYVYPTLDPGTRTLRVRLVFRNSDLQLRPEMYGDVVFERRTETALAVPDEAVLDLGTRQIVFVKLDNDRLQAREVEVGPEIGGWRSLLAGVTAGERVVTSGNFLIDAESKVRGVIPIPLEERLR